MGTGEKTVEGILERMRRAYGVSTSTELSELANIPKSTISNWLARGNIPFRYLYDCSNATGADVDWLLKGELANASFVGDNPPPYTKTETSYPAVLSSGGKAVLQRILMAYGFTTQKQLGDLLDISSGTMSTWIRRDYFPGDVVVACALDTGISLQWLATGKGEAFDSGNSKNNTISLPSFNLIAGDLKENGYTSFAKGFLPDVVKDAFLLNSQSDSWIIDRENKTVANGKWLLDIDGVNDVYFIKRLPANKIQVALSKFDEGFTCAIADVSCVGQVIFTIEKNY